MTEVPIIQKPVHSVAEQTNGLVSIKCDRDLHHERVNALLRVCIHRDYDKIIDIYTSMHPNIQG